LRFSRLAYAIRLLSGELSLKSDHQLRFEIEGVQVDIHEADSVLAETIFSRATRQRIVNAECNVATPEDLTILKTLADRPIDRRDVAELRKIFVGQLDESYIVTTLKKYQQLS
jgi:hypothetical protein